MSGRVLIRHASFGFTFIELILYMAIVSILLGALVPFAWSVIEAGTKSSVGQEVNSTARYISERIKYEIRDASGVNAVSATSISLSNTAALKNPTIIDLVSGNIRVTYGASAAAVLNSVDTTIPSLVFTNYSSADLKTKNIQFVFTVQSKNTSARQEYAASTSIRSTAEVRSN